MDYDKSTVPDPLMSQPSTEKSTFQNLNQRKHLKNLRKMSSLKVFRKSLCHVNVVVLEVMVGVKEVSNGYNDAECIVSAIRLDRSN